MLKAQPLLHDTTPTQPSACVSRRPPMRRIRSPRPLDHERPLSPRTRASWRGPRPSQTERLKSPAKSNSDHDPAREIYAPLPASTCHCEAPRGMVYADDDGDLTCALCGHSLAAATMAPAMAVVAAPADADRRAVR
jgi:hypothetical protein